MIGFALSQATPLIYFFPISLAITMGTTPLNWALIGDFFGRQSYASLRGMMAMVYGIATFLSPIYAGWIYDKTGGYTTVLVTFSIILLIPISIFAMLCFKTSRK
jgi:MFS family permease